MNIIEFEKELRSGILYGGSIRTLYSYGNEKKTDDDKTMDDLIKENYEKIVDKRIIHNLYSIIDALYERETMREFIREKMLYTFKVASCYDIEKLLTKDYGFEWTYFFEKNIDEILKDIDSIKISTILRLMENLSEFVKEKINNKILENKREYLKCILFSQLYESRNLEDYNVLLDVVERVIDSVLKNENKRLVDIKKMNSGMYSDVIEIGDKIVKLGIARETYSIAYDKRLLLPLIRVDLSKMCSLKATLEVTEKVNTNVWLDREDLYEIYRDMRIRGIVCADMRNENIGILLKDNKPDWHIELPDDLTTRGIIDVPEDREILRKGDYVVLDLDYIYKEDDPNIKWGNINTKRFEIRFQQEKKMFEKYGIYMDDLEAAEYVKARKK